jgi:SAM-dependent methyltransferase
MTDSIRTFIHYISGKINNHENLNPVFELGSLPAESQFEIANMRNFFKKKDYVGIDKYSGINVDKVANIENLDIENESVGVVLCLETIEHTEHPTRAVSEIYRILKNDGIIIISTPMYAPVHMAEDYWRVTPRGMKDILLYGYKEKEIYYQGEMSFPFNLVGIAGKSTLPFQIDLNYLNNMLPWPYPYPYKKL